MCDLSALQSGRPGEFVTVFSTIRRFLPNRPAGAVLQECNVSQTTGAFGLAEHYTEAALRGLDIVSETLTINLADCAALARRLEVELRRLHELAVQADVPPLEGRDWHELLVRKLLPQLAADAWLVVAVVGGTNIGKSIVFNHIVGGKISATSPLASGTKHPVCVVPTGFAARDSLPEIFPGFDLVDWLNADQPLDDTATHQLFIREVDHTPENLMVLDTPDIDSDARVNWDRADHIRQSADVLIAVLTQQKYNDAAVKEFFRKAAREDKVVIVVFNQVLLPEDEAYWPLWLNTFCDETGIVPQLVYVAPNDRRAADSLTLPFHERDWSPQSGDHRIHANNDVSDEQQGANLLEELSRLKFGEIKLRTLRGSLRQLLDSRVGVPGYLREINERSREFTRAAELLATHQLAEIDDWPPAPNSIMVTELRRWWTEQREGWSRRVHGFYNKVGAGIMWPIRFAREQISGPSTSPFDTYREREWSTILIAVDRVFEKLEFLAELGNQHLKPRLTTLLSGASREKLLETLRARHHEVDFAADLGRMIEREMARFRDESPRYYEMFKRLDVVAAAVRPATSVVLFITGFGAVAPMADTALQGALHVAGDLTGGTIAAAVGDQVISGGASSSMGYFEAKFRKLHAAFTAERAAWFARLLKTELLGELPEQLHAMSTIPESERYQAVAATVRELQLHFRR